jgi:hypothetical protein
MQARHQIETAWIRTARNYRSYGDSPAEGGIPLRATVSAVYYSHVPGVVTLAGGRREFVQPFDLQRAQSQAVCGDVLFDA